MRYSNTGASCTSATWDLVLPKIIRFLALFFECLGALGIEMLLAFGATIGAIIRLFSCATFGVASIASSFFNLFRILAISFCRLD